MAGVPNYWMNETSGVLRSAVEAYLRGRTMTPMQIEALRTYLRQWIMGPWWPSDRLDELRQGVDDLTSRQAISGWLAKADKLGIDPL